MTITEYVYHPERDGLVLLDVREAGERLKGRMVLGSVHVPLGELLAGEELLASADDPIVVLCERGGRAEIAVGYLRGVGYTNVEKLEGGYVKLAPYVTERELPEAVG